VGPLVLGLHVTARCNHRCGYCIYNVPGQYIPRDMTEEVADKVMSLLPTIQTVGLTGGEPMLCKDVWSILEAVKSRRRPVSISTNGTRLERNDLLHGVSVTVSARESDREKYLELTGVDAFDRMVEGIKNAQHSGARVGVSFVIDRGNVDSLERYARFAKKLGVHRVAFMGLLAGDRDDLKGRTVEQADMAIIEAQRPAIGRLGLRITQWPKPIQPDGPGGKCEMGRNHIAVDGDGNVALCCRGAGPRPEMGNILTDGPSVWSTGPMAELREKVYTLGEQPEKCLHCRENW